MDIYDFVNNFEIYEVQIKKKYFVISYDNKNIQPIMNQQKKAEIDYYIGASVKIGCPFCTIDKNETNLSFIQEFEYGTLFLNYNQSYLGRCLYIPAFHYTSVTEIPSELFSLYYKELHFVAICLEDVLQADLINIAMLGNKIRHIHWHLIPRYKSDENWGFAPWPNQEVTLPTSTMKDLIEKIRQHFISA
jgi:diadenosine tetraphosphate (Ap4A) HIT family hydrolase